MAGLIDILPDLLEDVDQVNYNSDHPEVLFSEIRHLFLDLEALGGLSSHPIGGLSFDH